MIDPIDAGFCLCLAVVGVLCAGLIVEPAPNEVGKRTVVLFEDEIYRSVYRAAIVYCVFMISIRAIISWDMVSFSSVVTLACGFIAIAVNYAFNRVQGRKWKKIPTPIVGGVMALCSAIFICVLIFPAFNEFEHEARIAPPDRHALIMTDV